MFHLTYLALLQDATLSQGYAPYIAGTIVLSAVGWVLKTTRDVARTLERIEQYLFGIKGSNGLDSKVTKIQEDVDYLLERRVGPDDRRRQSE